MCPHTSPPPFLSRFKDINPLWLSPKDARCTQRTMCIVGPCSLIHTCWYIYNLLVATPQAGTTPLCCLPAVLSLLSCQVGMVVQLSWINWKAKACQNISNRFWLPEEGSSSLRALRFKSKSAEEINGVLIQSRTGTMEGKGGGAKEELIYRC